MQLMVQIYKFEAVTHRFRSLAVLFSFLATIALISCKTRVTVLEFPEAIPAPGLVGFALYVAPTASGNVRIPPSSITMCFDDPSEQRFQSNASAAISSMLAEMDLCLKGTPTKVVHEDENFVYRQSDSVQLQWEDNFTTHFVTAAMKPGRTYYLSSVSYEYVEGNARISGRIPLPRRLNPNGPAFRAASGQITFLGVIGVIGVIGEGSVEEKRGRVVSGAEALQYNSEARATYGRYDRTEAGAERLFFEALRLVPRLPDQWQRVVEARLQQYQ